MPFRLRSIRFKVLLSPFFPNQKSKGGAAIEYIIVSTFALLLAVAGITFVSKTVKEKIKTIEDKLGITLESDDFDIIK